MKIRLGQLVFVDPTPDELDELVRRYGGAAEAEGEGTSQKPPKLGPKPMADGPRDSVILRVLVDAGLNGVPTKQVGELLGRRGKAMRGAAKIWAVRVGLTHEAGSDPFEDCRVGTARGIRIKPNLHDLAKELLRGGGGS